MKGRVGRIGRRWNGKERLSILYNGSDLKGVTKIIYKDKFVTIDRFTKQKFRNLQRWAFGISFKFSIGRAKTVRLYLRLKLL